MNRVWIKPSSDEYKGFYAVQEDDIRVLEVFVTPDYTVHHSSCISWIARRTDLFSLYYQFCNLVEAIAELDPVHAYRNQKTLKFWFGGGAQMPGFATNVSGELDITMSGDTKAAANEIRMQMKRRDKNWGAVRFETNREQVTMWAARDDEVGIGIKQPSALKELPIPALARMIVSTGIIGTADPRVDIKLTRSIDQVTEALQMIQEHWFNENPD